MVSVPQIQTIEFVSKNNSGKGVSYDHLKLIVIQDEATRNQVSSGGVNEARAANLARSDNRRCYECQASGHIGANCPNRGEGTQCYNCLQFTDHIAANCPHLMKLEKKHDQYKTSKYNNSHSRGRNYRGYGRRRDLKRQNNNDARSSDSKRGRYNNYRGRGRGRGRNNYNNKNNRNDNTGNKGNSTKQANQQSNENAAGEKNTNKAKENFVDIKDSCLSHVLAANDALNIEDVDTNTVYTPPELIHKYKI
ncbi:GATA zinc finger domain-containing protein 4-like [Belonocnema kinseyi]|uniref:GATA zinc finger domain-containing protein 4-like n=1 Tax=Belonocnema kinseyi TaxID=2817044 RepID=UPI00143D3EF8|nr:GATA zinc finger domain-containing protein 4-like [Belonocnema kinseyi]